MVAHQENLRITIPDSHLQLGYGIIAKQANNQFARSRYVSESIRLFVTSSPIFNLKTYFSISAFSQSLLQLHVPRLYDVGFTYVLYGLRLVYI